MTAGAHATAICADFRIAAVIPMYQGEPYIADALSSVLNQTRPADEIIVVDDGSTDAGPQIVAQFAKQHPVTLLRQSNRGQAAARNFGIASCSSDLIALLDQDDVWYINHLEELVKPFLRHRTTALGWVYSDLDVMDETGHIVAHQALSSLQHVQHPKRDLDRCLATDMYVLPSASLISRKAFTDVGGFDERLRGYEDDDLFLRLFLAGYDNVFIAPALSRWRIQAGSSSFSPAMAISRMLYLRKLLTEFSVAPARSKSSYRDIVIRRFLPHLLAEFVKAVQYRDHDLTRRSQENLEFASRYRNRWFRMGLQLCLRLVRIPGVAGTLRWAHPAVQPLTRRILG